eukprot:TRINITY_DN32258_c0_g1_i2.p2 TRINITY_DN32258_c0_g1~~TRINITY_DN32258_c0_g1_i2.p2  ORF type:complete len:125 (-),score=38.02 TRINITY_DN32258_c0_g1_i2:160-534(-)
MPLLNLHPPPLNLAALQITLPMDPSTGSKVATPVTTPVAGQGGPMLFTPSLGMIKQDGVEGKIRNWLATIPIGNGAERGWDDSQIVEIASFAEGRSLDHLDAQEIYKLYVEHQVEQAANEAEMG